MMIRRLVIPSVLLVLLSFSCGDDEPTGESAAGRDGGGTADAAATGGGGNAAAEDTGDAAEDGGAGTGPEADAALPPCEPAESSRIYTWSFDGEPAGSSPGGLTSFLGTWKVEADADAPSGPNVLRQSDTSLILDYPIAFADAPCFEDLTLEVRCRPESGAIDQACGLMFRLQDPKNYYVTRANVLESNVRLYRVVDGVRTQFATAEGISIAGNEWHTLRATAAGSSFTVSFDDEEVISAQDDTFAGSGRVGLWLKADSVTSFDDLTATAE